MNFFLARSMIIFVIKYGLGASIVFFQFDDSGSGKQVRKIHDIAKVGPAKSVDTLGIVAYHHYARYANGPAAGR